jgi:hypothetical protein
MWTQTAGGIMRKLWCILFISICSLSLTAGVSAKAYKEFPPPVWTAVAPDGVEDLRVVNNLIYAMSYDYTTVYNDRTGSKSATLTYPSNLLSSSFNQDNTLLDKQGIFYRIVATMNTTPRECTYSLKALSPACVILWTKIFPEKVPSYDVRIYAQNDGTILAVLKTNDKQYLSIILRLILNPNSRLPMRNITVHCLTGRLSS